MNGSIAVKRLMAEYKGSHVHAKYTNNLHFC